MFVLFLDLLGFRNLELKVTDSEMEKIKSYIEVTQIDKILFGSALSSADFSPQLKKFIRTYCGFQFYTNNLAKPIKERTIVASFSDSIVVFNESLPELVTFAIDLQRRMYEESIAVRGGISKGMFLLLNTTDMEKEFSYPIFGSSIIGAYTAGSVFRGLRIFVDKKLSDELLKTDEGILFVQKNFMKLSSFETQHSRGDVLYELNLLRRTDFGATDVFSRFVENLSTMQSEAGDGSIHYEVTKEALEKMRSIFFSKRK